MAGVWVFPKPSTERPRRWCSTVDKSSLPGRGNRRGARPGRVEVGPDAGHVRRQEGLYPRGSCLQGHPRHPGRRPPGEIDSERPTGSRDLWHDLRRTRCRLAAQRPPLDSADRQRHQRGEERRWVGGHHASIRRHHPGDHGSAGKGADPGPDPSQGRDSRPASATAPQVETLTDPIDSSMPVARVLRREKEEASGPKLEDAAIIVSGGRGLGAPENFKMLDELATDLGARSEPAAPSSMPAGSHTRSRLVRPERPSNQRSISLLASRAPCSTRSE